MTYFLAKSAHILTLGYPSGDGKNITHGKIENDTHFQMQIDTYASLLKWTYDKKNLYITIQGVDNVFK